MLHTKISRFHPETIFINIPVHPVSLSLLNHDYGHKEKQTTTRSSQFRSHRPQDHGGVVPGRILQLLQGLVGDGAHAVVDKHAAQKHGQGKDPRVILRVTLGSILGQDISEFTM